MTTYCPPTSPVCPLVSLESFVFILISPLSPFISTGELLPLLPLIFLLVGSSLSEPVVSSAFKFDADNFEMSTGGGLVNEGEGLFDAPIDTVAGGDMTEGDLIAGERGDGEVSPNEAGE